ncbi:MAG: M81 family metallopeptidase [Chloroflexi bacterium]|nr:M81 family metallopeptidase [Chloroflexota bacterium]
MRVAIAELKQESNTFVPRPTTLADFAAWHLWHGADLVSGLRDTNTEIAGFLDVLEPAGIESVPILATFAMSGGKVVTAAYHALLDDLLAGVREHGPYDGVLLALHGAMVSDEDDDPDGAIIAAVRAAIGADTPLVVTMDLHANVTRRAGEHADAIVGFRTSPHIDLRETGQRGAGVMVRMLRDGVRPAMAMVKIPMVVPASTHMHHLPGPFQRLMQAAAAAEGGSLLSASVFTVQPWLDITEMGFATVAVSDGDVTLAEQVALELANLAWAERDAFMETELVPIAEAIARAGTIDGPVVLSDLADGTGAGSPGDATAVIAALLAAELRDRALVCVRDPGAARTAIAAGIGAEVALEVGGKLDNVYNEPVPIRGTVTFAGPARFRFSGEGYTGVEMDMGDCAVIEAGQVSLLILGNAVMTVDPAMYRAVGLEPNDAGIVVVKSHIQFRAGYGDVARAIILLDSPGMSSDRLESLPFVRIERPLFPFDRAFEFVPHPVSRRAADAPA